MHKTFSSSAPSDLVQHATSIFNSINLEKLHEEGIRNISECFGDTHINATYPLLRELRDIGEKEIFSDFHLGNKKVSLYIHIPFCTGWCNYCHYVIQANSPKGKVDAYVSVLKKEIQMLAGQKALKNMKISSIHIGGGTPTYLDERQITNLLSFLKENLDIEKGAEITMESSPETLNEKKLNAIAKSGVNRLSIGIQSFTDNVLNSCGRRHDSKAAIYAFKNAKNAGIENVNFDLMIGLPHQNLENFEDNLDIAEKLAPESITLYNMRIKPFVPMARIYQTKPEIFPTQDEILIMKIMAAEKFNELGYEEWPVQWFNKSQKFRYRHQTEKWQHLTDLIGVGVSAYSYINKIQYHNHHSVLHYIGEVAKGKLPIWKGKKLSKQEQMKRNLIFGLKTSVDNAKFKEEFGLNPKDAFPDFFNKLENLDLMNSNSKTMTLNSKGRLFAEEIGRLLF